jgi:hypothetical protein
MIGENSNGIPNNLMPFVTKLAVGHREKLSIFGGYYNTIDVTGERDCIHLVELARGHVACDLKKYNLDYIVSSFNTSRVSQVLVEEMPHKDVNKFGIVDLDGAAITPVESAKIYGMVENPDIEDAPSNLAIVGSYVLSE